MYYYPIYLDWWGLIRRALLDMSRELGFCIGRWNQGYQVDTLPIVLEQSELKPGDMIFYSGMIRCFNLFSYVLQWQEGRLYEYGFSNPNNKHIKLIFYRIKI